jgi:hypothetical protein
MAWIGDHPKALNFAAGGGKKAQEKQVLIAARWSEAKNGTERKTVLSRSRTPVWCFS